MRPGGLFRAQGPETGVWRSASFLPSGGALGRVVSPLRASRERWREG